MTKLAKVIAMMEGFYKEGSLPKRNNNPGDLRHSPHAAHSNDPNSIGAIDTVEHGWDDLERQILLDANRGLTLEQFIQKFAPPNENNTANYLKFACDSLDCGPETLLTYVIRIKA